MSAADKHRAAAQRSMRLADESSYADAAGQHRATARAFALLAIEARLGELDDVLREAHKPAVVEVSPFVVRADGDPAKVAEVVADVYDRAKQSLGGDR